MPLFLDILWRETQHDPELRRRAFVGLSRYQQAVRPPSPAAMPVMAQAGPARLFHYGAHNKGESRAPLVFIPSLINPPTVLDLSESQSVLRGLARAGHDPWLVDWGTPGPGDGGLDLAGHVLHRLLPLLEALDRPPILIGYCLGGTLAMAAAGLMPAIAGLVTIATPWDFGGFPDAARAEVSRMWGASKAVCTRLGYVPMEVLQSGFWSMDPARTIRKYAGFGEVAPDSDRARAFLALEDWANAGPPLTFAAGRELFEDLYAANKTGAGSWTVGDIAINASEMACPTLSIRSSSDRIVPAATAPALAEQWLLDLGHVGMVVGGRASDMLWHPLSQWLSKHEG